MDKIDKLQECVWELHELIEEQINFDEVNEELSYTSGAMFDAKFDDLIERIKDKQNEIITLNYEINGIVPEKQN